MPTTKTPTTAYVICVDGFHASESLFVRRGDRYDANAPIVQRHARMFVDADASEQTKSEARAALLPDPAATWQPPPPPKPVQMKATRRFVTPIVTTTDRVIEKGETIMSDDA